MSKFSRISAAVLLTMAMGASAAVAEPKLKMGDAAPALSVEKFVKGEPVKGFEKGKIYVVEFWATWCGPCRQSIPHLTEMQKANPEVIFIGCDVGETEEKVAPFVKEMDTKMDYRVAVDDLKTEGGATNAAYMTAAEENGIPTAFLIDKDSKVAWIGHPMELEPVLKKVVAGTYDMKQAAAEKESKTKLMGMLQANDFDGALKATDDMIAADPSQASSLGVMQFQILMMGKKDAAAAAKKAEELSGKVDDADSLNMMAWTLATAPKTTPESLATAQKLSESSLTKKAGNPEYLDTLARIYAVKNDFAKATELETQAVAKCDDEKLKPTLTTNLEAYKAGKLPAAE